MNKKANKIITAGHICLDITPNFYSDESRDLSQILVPGKLVNMNGVYVSPGGSVANTGLALAKLGNDVCLISRIGNDSFGNLLISELEQYNVKLNISTSRKSRTSYSIVICPPNVDRIFLHDSGANCEFSISDIDFSLLKDAKIFHFGYPPLMDKIFENNGFELTEILKKVKEAGVLTSVDMVAIDPKSVAGSADWVSIIKNILPYVDYFMPSVEELAYMIDKELYDKWILLANGQDIINIIDIENEVVGLSNKLSKMGANNILIKCGSKGMYFKNCDIEIFEESYKPKVVKSATGAGDTSIAAFLTGIMKDYDIKKCLRLATATGAICVENFDSLSSIESLSHIETKINTDWEKQRLELCNEWKYDIINEFWYKN